MTLNTLYLEYLLNASLEKVDYNEQVRLLNAMNRYYFNENKAYVDISNQDGIDSLLSFVADKCRYQVFSTLVDEQIKTLYTDDNGDENIFVKTNLVPIIDGIYEELYKKLCSLRIVDLELHTISGKIALTQKVADVLEKIDPSLECLNSFLKFFNKSTKEGIIFLDELSDKERSEVLSLKEKNELIDDDKIFTLSLTNGKRIIILDYKGNLNDVVSIVHELGHYLFPIENFSLPIIRELSSIFYEIYALNFILESLNGSDTFLISKERFDYLRGIIDDTIVIRNCIKLAVKNNGVINKENFGKELYNLIVKYRLKLSLKINNKVINIDMNNVLQYIDNICDYLIVLFLNMKTKRFSLSFINQYVVGSYLALCAMDNINNFDMLERMLNYSYNMSKMNFYDIFVGLGVPVEQLGIVNIDSMRTDNNKK